MVHGWFLLFAPRARKCLSDGNPSARWRRSQPLHRVLTDSPTAAWTAQQVVEAFPHDSAPRFLIRDRDSIFGGQFRQRVKAIGVAEVLTTPRSPWQNPFAERVIGTIRRELLDHVIVLNERHLRRRLRNYLGYYHASRTHLALGKDAPEPRPVEPPERRDIVAVPQVGGLHHLSFARVAAGGCPPAAPTDPDVQNSRIRLFGTRIRYAGE